MARLSTGVQNAMEEASLSFVQLDQLQSAVCARLAPLFGSQCVHIVSSGPAGILLAAAVCACGDDRYRLSTLPQSGQAYTVSVLPGDEVPCLPITLCGMKVRRGGIPESGVVLMSERLLSPGFDKKKNRKLVVYCAGPVAKERIPAICAAADAVIFENKVFHAPVMSAYLAASAPVMRGIRWIAAPKHGIGRSFKTGKEEIAGAYWAALEFFRSDET